MFAGNWIIVFDDKPPEWHILTMQQIGMFFDRVRLGGLDKAGRHTWGKGFVCFEMVESAQQAALVAESYNGVWQEQVQGLAACIATGIYPNRDNKGSPDGGLKVEADRPAPTKPRGGGQAKKLGAFQALMTG